MGILNYHSWFKTTFPECLIAHNKPILVNNAYIDGNYLYHIAINKCTNIEQFYANLTSRLNIFFCNIIPKKSITFVVDGVAPYAKIMEQIGRRENYKTDTFSPNILTCGLDILVEIEKETQNILQNIINDFKNIKLKLIFSSSCIPGEGEVKILNEISKNSINNHNINSNYILSADSDLIVGLLINNYCNIYLSYQDKQNGNFYIDINKLKQNKNYHQYFMQDLAFISLLGGNDYFPKLIYLNMDKIYQTYISMDHYDPLIKNLDLFFYKLFILLQKTKQKNLHNINQ